MKKLTAERQRLAAEVQLKREIEQQYAKRCTFQVGHSKLQLPGPDLTEKPPKPVAHLESTLVGVACCSHCHSIETDLLLPAYCGTQFITTFGSVSLGSLAFSSRKVHSGLCKCQNDV